MNGYSEFYLENECLVIHIEYYNGVARHYIDYSLSKEDTLLLTKIDNIELNTLVKEYTSRFSMGNSIIDYLQKKGIQGVVIDKGYEDTSSDV